MIRPCVVCKTKIEVPNLQTKYCGNCKDMKSDIPVRIQKCKFCETPFKINTSKIYCSHTCRTKYHNIPQDIARCKKMIEKYNNKLKLLEIKYESL
jgi:hypothetical protein